MNSNFGERNNLIFQTINNNDFNNNYSQNQTIKKYWCHLCKKEFSHEYQNDDVKCLFCNKTFCEIIENEDTSNPLHPIHFEPFTFHNSNSHSINSQNENSINNNNINNNEYDPYISRPSLTMSNILRRASSLQLINFLSTLHFHQNHNDNIDDIINHLMLHDTNKYGNPPAAKKEVKKLKKYIINEEKLKEFGFENSCAVCKDEFNIGEECLSMPCKHYFHDNCILPWLKERNSCPICRYELPTDDKDFEEMKKIRMKNESNRMNNPND